jgi:Mn-dependent DtxR family transcriptional regulator
MGQKRKPTPAAARCLREIKKAIAKGEVPTLGVLVRRLGVTKTAVAESVTRLERLGVLSRPKHRQGYPRPIKLLNSD